LRRILDHPDNKRETEIISRYRAERLQSIGPTAIELWCWIEVGDCKVTVTNTFDLIGANAKGRR
jgi:hypothetical protein